MGSLWLHDIGIPLLGMPHDFYPGWETRSRSSGGFDQILGIGLHHTASETDAENDMHYMWNASGDRPLANLYIARDGFVTMGAAGAVNTHGKGGPLICANGDIPFDSGNKYLIGIEAGNNGIDEPWPDAQINSYVMLVERLCDHYGLSKGDDLFGHFDYCAPSCPGRKIDPAGPSPFGSVTVNGTWDIQLFRSAVLGGVYNPVPPSPEPAPLPPQTPQEAWMEALPNLMYGDRGAYVLRMQHLLAANGFLNPPYVSEFDGIWGNGTDSAKRDFDAAHNLTRDESDCDARSWESLMTGRVW